MYTQRKTEFDEWQFVQIFFFFCTHSAHKQWLGDDYCRICLRIVSAYTVRRLFVLFFGSEVSPQHYGVGDQSKRNGSNRLIKQNRNVKWSEPCRKEPSVAALLPWTRSYYTCLVFIFICIYTDKWCRERVIIFIIYLSSINIYYNQLLWLKIQILRLIFRHKTGYNSHHVLRIFTIPISIVISNLESANLWNFLHIYYILTYVCVHFGGQQCHRIFVIFVRKRMVVNWDESINIRHWRHPHITDIIIIAIMTRRYVICNNIIYI